MLSIKQVLTKYVCEDVYNMICSYLVKCNECNECKQYDLDCYNCYNSYDDLIYKPFENILTHNYNNRTDNNNSIEHTIIYYLPSFIKVFKNYMRKTKGSHKKNRHYHNNNKRSLYEIIHENCINDCRDGHNKRNRNGYNDEWCPFIYFTWEFIDRDMCINGTPINVNYYDRNINDTLYVDNLEVRLYRVHKIIYLLITIKDNIYYFKFKNLTKRNKVNDKYQIDKKKILLTPT